jgi:hypothetical protein
MLGLAGGEAMLACWEAKYHYMIWRPVPGDPARRRGRQRRHGPEAGWAPLVRANHPEYPSGHACYGTAMVTGLKKVFGEDFPVTLTSTGQPGHGSPVVPTRSYASLDEIIDDTANARVWAGLHLRTTMDATARWMAPLVHEALRGHFQRTRSRDHRDCK